jgi:hypothetical protein
MGKAKQRTQESDSSLEQALRRQEQRASCDAFVGEVVPDRNFPNRLLIVSNAYTFYSVGADDVVEKETYSETTQRIWIRRGAAVWQCTRALENYEQGNFVHFMERIPPPAVRLLPGDPQPGTAADQQKLSSGTKIEGAAKLFANSCQGGDAYDNNCAHFLSDAFIRAGFSELRNANQCINARCETSANRPIRARDMWCWFQSKATQAGRTVTRNTGIWAVFQVHETQYWGGHVVIIDSGSWKFYGTGWYGQWDQYSYKW